MTMPAAPPPEWITRAAEWLRVTHWDGNGCGTHGTNACSRCYGPSPADTNEIADDVLEVIWPDVLAAVAAHEQQLRQTIANDLEAEAEAGIERGSRDDWISGMYAAAEIAAAGPAAGESS